MAVVRKTKKVSRKNRNKKTRKYRNIQRGGAKEKSRFKNPFKNLFKRTPSIANVIGTEKPHVLHTNTGSSGKQYAIPFDPTKVGSASKMPLPPVPPEQFRLPPVNTPGQKYRSSLSIKSNLTNAFEKGVLTLTKRQQNAAKRATFEVKELQKRFLTSEEATEHMAAHKKVVIPENPYSTVTYINKNTSGATSA